MISEETINEITNKIIKYENPEKIILFGSYANGNATVNSDLDFMVIKQTDDKIYKRGRDLKWELADYPFKIDLLIKTPNEFSKWSDIPISFNAKVNNKGKILYEQTI